MEKSLNDDFVFTQQSLKTFKDCPMKFKKKYIENIRWEGPYDESSRKRTEKGNDFHLMAFRYFSGIETNLKFEIDTELDRWLKSLKESFPLNKGVRYLPEHKARILEEDLRLEANFDLLLIKDGSIEIWDWKTHENKIKNPTRLQENLKNSMQTMVYLYVLKEQAQTLYGRKQDNISVSMHYWQPETPHILAELEYNDELHRQNKRELLDLIKKTNNFDYTAFEKDLYKKHCSFCEFNMFCNNERIDFSDIEDSEYLIPF
ncbi:MAG: PD-(D/E)XK nuclease family protein [Bacillota bacterium]|nr:PD-(D/E)XK nuclease family protein [Bacillota bacterium]